MTRESLLFAQPERASSSVCGQVLPCVPDPTYRLQTRHSALLSALLAAAPGVLWP